MHRSRLSDILIDCSTDAMEAGVQFWSRALGIHCPNAARTLTDTSSYTTPGINTYPMNFTPVIPHRCTRLWSCP